jgi:Mrp family chromosome partitioning ATPase
MSDVLQLSGVSSWTTLDKPGNPTLESDRDQAFADGDTPDAGQATEATPPTSVAEKLGRRHSAATPYLQYLTALVQRIFLTQDRGGDQIRSVVFTGVGRRGTCALLSAATAELLATRVSGRVCLVDAVVRKPSLHECYGVSNDIGLLDAWRGTGPVRSYARRLVQGHESSLWLLSSGTSRNVNEPTPEEVQTRMRDLTAAFDYVIIAAPSVTEDPAVTAIAAQVDGVVLTVEAHVSRRRVVQATADSVRAAGGRVLGSVLSNRTFPIPDAIYRLL